MQNNYYSTYSCINIYERPSINAKISSQIIYGEKFKVLKKIKSFLKIRTSYDRYTGYIKNKKFIKKFKPSHKVKTLKTRIYKSNSFLPFSSEIEIIKKKKNYAMFEKNKWVKFNELEIINKKDCNFSKIFKYFLKIKYKWGGKTFDGIDCSALLQIFYKYNHKFFPRDTKDQVKIKKGVRNKRVFKKGDIIFWKGHVAVCLNTKELIHAYGPRKKVIIMPIIKTIKLIEKTTNLKVIKIISI